MRREEGLWEIVGIGWWDLEKGDCFVSCAYLCVFSKLGIDDGESLFVLKA